MVNKRNTTIRRLLIAAATGGLTAVIVGIFPWMNVIIRFFLMTVISSVIMLVIAYGKMNKADFIKQVITLYLLTYFLGGLINSIYYQTNFGINMVRLGNLLFSNLTWKAVLLFIIPVIPVTFCGLWLFRIINSKKRDTLDTELFFGDNCVSTKGLVDTGNCLYDPVFRKPVIIIENILLKELIPMDLYQELLMIKRSIADNAPYIENQDVLCTNQIKIRIIPYKSIGKQKGMLLGLVLDKVLVKQGKDTICNEKVTAAIYDDILSTGNEYHVILHKELL
jgi:stage II sporulation protein GA (sporulation sigma-E factor processing peptidase)